MDRIKAQNGVQKAGSAERQLLRETPGQGQMSEIATQNGRVMLIRDALRSAEAPLYLDFIRKFSFDATLFSRLLNGTYKDWIEICKPETTSLETITVRIGATADGKKFEGTLTTMYNPSTMKIRLPKPAKESIGFEAILSQEGSITYDILQRYDHISGEYKKPKEVVPISVTLKPGDLLLIPRSVARQVSEVVNNPRYLYIGDPWTKDDMPVEVT
jgi:hypothetical protein